MSVKAKAYLTLVRPIVEYASSCWAPSSAFLNHHIEMLQHSAAKFSANYYPKVGHFNDFSVTKIIRSLGWDTLEERRDQAQLTMAYKILNGSVILPSDSLQRKQHTRPSRSCNNVKVGPKHQLH